MPAAGILLTYLQVKSRLASNDAALVKAQGLRDSVAKSIAKLEKTEAAWDKAYEKAIDNNSDLKVNGRVIVKSGNVNTATAEHYADLIAKVCRDDIDSLMYDLNDQESDWDCQIASLQADNESGKTFAESLKQQLSAECQDTHMINGN